MRGLSTSRGERIVFASLAAVAWGYVVIRAFSVPFVHDEARTFFLYNAVGRFQPWYSFLDAANHLLNTALGQVSYLLFGPAAWSLRLFNVLSFLLYAWYVGRLGGLIEHRVARWCLWTALLFMPFGIEFFSLYRGYGLGMAFLVMALYHLLRFSEAGRYLHLLGALSGMLLATYASFSLLVLWCAVLAYLAFLFVRLRAPMKQSLLRWAAWCTLGLFPLIYLSAYAKKLADHGALYYGTDKGMIGGTLTSLCLSMFASAAPWLMASIVVLLCLVVAQGVAVCLRDPRTIGRSPLTVLVYLLVTEVAGRYVLGSALGMLYPTDRTALHLFVLIPVLVSFGADDAAFRRPWMRWGSLVLLILPFYFVKKMNTDRTSTWPDQAIQEDLFDRVAAYRRPDGGPFVIGASKFLCMPWDLRNITRSPALPPIQEMPLGTDGADLLLIPEREVPRFPAYDVLVRGGRGGAVLCERRAQRDRKLLLDTVLRPSPEPMELMDLWTRPSRGMGKDTLLVEVEAVITAPGPFDAWLVCSEDGLEGVVPGYAALDLSLARTHWRQDTLRVTRWMPLTGTASDGSAYVRLWNRKKRPFTLHHARLRIHRLSTTSEVQGPTSIP